MSRELRSSSLIFCCLFTFCFVVVVEVEVEIYSGSNERKQQSSEGALRYFAHPEEKSTVVWEPSWVPIYTNILLPGSILV
jgi:hypothetical protein